MADVVLSGAACSVALTAEAVTISGDYHRYDDHKRRRASGTVTVSLSDVLRVGLTKTYSRRAFLLPMAFGFLALIIKSIPAIEVSYDIIPDVYSVGYTFWSVPHQETAWHICAALCLLTIPIYWLSYRNDLEINTIRGRYLLSRKGMDAAQIAAFQSEFTRLKEAGRKAK